MENEQALVHCEKVGIKVLEAASHVLTDVHYVIRPVTMFDTSANIPLMINGKNKSFIGDIDIDNREFIFLYKLVKLPS